MRALNQTFRRNALSMAIASVISSAAWANPSGLSVVAGQATLQNLGGLTQITNTPGAILNWQQFSIGAGETTQFLQQNAASQVFNRVTGGDVSQILGALKSNGQVFLINPAGIVFGQGAQVDTAGFLASTLAASNTDLMKGHLTFSAEGGAGSIVNQGSLSAMQGGSIVLIAPNIENSGLIRADGQVLLAAGHSVTVVDLMHPTVGLSITAEAGSQAVNLGQVIGQAASVFGALVRNTGVVEATGASVAQGGVIRFKALGGTAQVGGVLTANSATGQGGTIEVTGQSVQVDSTARIHADGATGGGVVRLGGAWQGDESVLSSAHNTSIDAGALVTANSTVQGSGGEVVAWSSGHTDVQGQLQARGGAAGGHGGRIETSGRQSLTVGTAADTSAPKGHGGTWLLDPQNLHVVATPTNSTSTESYVTTDTVQNGLQYNGTVILEATGGVDSTTQQTVAGNLSIDAPIQLSATGASGGAGPYVATPVPTLVLKADGVIDINAALSIAPNQTDFTGLNLGLSHDVDRPVYVRAPLDLGQGGLYLVPFDDPSLGLLSNPGGTGVSPTGVNFLAGAGSTTAPSQLRFIEVLNNFSDIGIPDPQTQAAPLPGIFTDAQKSVQININGAHVRAGDVYPDYSAQSNFAQAIPMDLTVNNGSLTVGTTFGVRKTTVNAGGMFANDPALLRESITGVSMDQLDINGGTANLTEFNDIQTVNVNSGTLNVRSGNASNSGLSGDVLSMGSTGVLNSEGSYIFFNDALVNGTINVNNNPSNSYAYGTLLAKNFQLNGQLNLNQTAVTFQNLSMGAASVLTMNGPSFLQLGTNLTSNYSGVPQAGHSSSDGSFAAVTGSKIVMNGLTAPVNSYNGSTDQISTVSHGAVISLDGLDGQLNAPVTIQVNGFENAIETFVNNSYSVTTIDPQTQMPISSLVSTPITSMSIQQANIQVNGGALERTLFIGQRPNYASTSPSSVGGQSVPDSTVNLSLQGTLNIQSGGVNLRGQQINTTGGTITVNGATSGLSFNGGFSSADLNAVTRSNGGLLAVAGRWDNSAVTAQNAGSSSPLAKGDIIVFDDLTIQGGYLSSGTGSGKLTVEPDRLLELRNITVAANIDLGVGSALLLGNQDNAGNAVPAPIFAGSTVTLAGNDAIVVEADANGVANLNGQATFTSANQGNALLAGRKLYDANQAVNIPDAMTLNVGSGIRLQVTGNNPTNTPATNYYYQQSGVQTPPVRPVFTVGQLPLELVTQFEYEPFSGSMGTPVGTVLSTFANPSFVVDGTPDPLLLSSVPNFYCDVTNLCVKFDVDQSGSFAGSVMTSLNPTAPSLSTSGVAFANQLDLSQIQFAAVNDTDIVFMTGINDLRASDLASGRRLVAGTGSTIRFGNNLANEVLGNAIANDGVVDFSGNYTLSGAISGTGTISNSGVLTLSNTQGTSLSNNLLNNGTLNNTGNYVFNGSMGGIGSFVNAGQFTFTLPGMVGNTVNNAGGLMLQGSAGQSYTFMGGVSNSGQFRSNGAQLDFGPTGFQQTAGTAFFAPGTVSNGNMVFTGGAFRGFGSFTGDVSLNNTRFAPGASPGAVTVSGNLTLNSSSVTDIEVRAAGQPGVDYDVVLVTGTAALDGQLNLIDISNGGSGGALTSGSTYTFLQASAITGQFAAVSPLNTGLLYTFSPPFAGATANGAALSTSIVDTPGNAIGSGSTGSTTTSPISQNLNQAFLPPPTGSTLDGSANTPPPPPPSGTTTTSNSEPTPQEQQQANELASQNTGPVPVSQQNPDLLVRSGPSDPKRPAAVCK